MFEILVTVLLVLLVLIVYFQEKRIKTMAEGLYNLSLSQQYSIEASKIQNNFNQALSDSHTQTNDHLDHIEHSVTNLVSTVGETTALVHDMERNTEKEIEQLKFRVGVLESKSDGGVADLFSSVISHNKTIYKKGE